MYKVEITNITKGTNLTQGLVFTPILLATHKPGVHLFNLGEPASEAFTSTREGDHPMKQERAKEILSAHRAGLGDETDPDVVEALRALERDEELAAWYEADRQFDARFRRAIAGVQVPERQTKAPPGGQAATTSFSFATFCLPRRSEAKTGSKPGSGALRCLPRARRSPSTAI